MRHSNFSGRGRAKPPAEPFVIRLSRRLRPTLNPNSAIADCVARAASPWVWRALVCASQNHGLAARATTKPIAVLGLKTSAIFATLLTIVLALALNPAPARAQAARSDTPATIGNRRVTTSGTVPRMDTSAAANANASSSGTASASSTATATGVSPRASSLILSGFKYQPPPPPKAQDDDEVDLRDIDKPKNDIIRLPKLTVTAKKPEVFTDRTLYTHDQLKTLAMARYLGALDKKLLNKWTFADIGLSIGATNADRAMQMYLDDERLQNMDTAQRQITTAQAAGNADAAQQMKSQYYDMFLRPPDKVNASPDSLTKQRGQ